MKRWVMIFLVLVVTAVLSLACSGTQKNTKDTKDTMIRCPKCGAYFGSELGAESFGYTIGPPGY